MPSGNNRLHWVPKEGAVKRPRKLCWTKGMGAQGRRGSVDPKTKAKIRRHRRRVARQLRRRTGLPADLAALVQAHRRAVVEAAIRAKARRTAERKKRRRAARLLKIDGPVAVGFAGQELGVATSAVVEEKR